MNYHIKRTEKFSFGSIQTKGSGVVMAHISIDTHTDNKVIEQAIQLLYPDILLSGAGKYSREQFLDAVNSIGASIGTSVSNGVLTITLRSTHIVFPKLIKLVEIMLTNPTFQAKEIKRINTTVSNELIVQQEQSSLKAHEQLANTLYANSDRRYVADHKTLVAALGKITKKNLQKFHQQVTSAPWTCSIAGTKKDITNFEQLVNALKEDTEISHNSLSHKQKTPRSDLRLLNIPSRANIDFSIGLPVPITLHHPDYLPLTFGLGVLAIPGFAGRLMNTVRDKEGLTYTIYGSLESFSGTEQGFVRIYTFFSPDKTVTGLNSTFRELKKLYQKGITNTEFKTFHKIFATKQTLLQDSLLRQLSDLHSFNRNGFSVDEIKAFKAKMRSVTRKQVNEAIKKYLDPANFVISGAGPTANVKKDLQTFFKNVQ
jgi:zinc protease